MTNIRPGRPATKTRVVGNCGQAILTDSAPLGERNAIKDSQHTFDWLSILSTSAGYNKGLVIKPKTVVLLKRFGGYLQIFAR